MKNGLYSCIVLCLLLVFCKNKDYSEGSARVISLKKEKPEVFSTPEKLIAFVDNSESGFVKSKTIGRITYNSMLKPIDYLLAQRRIKEGNPDLKREDFEDLQYFDLRIVVNEFSLEFIKFDLSSDAQYEERVNYCAFKMQEDIKLIDGKDTLKCVLFHHERAFNIVPYGHFILGFENKKSDVVNSKTLLFNDRLFNNGIIKFTFLPEILIQEPMLL